MSSVKSLSPETIAKAGAGVALMTIGAWITVSFGPVPFTLQTMATSFIICALDSKASTLALCVYLILGALGLPVFSGMRGGVGVLFGPTGGYLLAFVLITFVCSFLRKVMGPSVKRDIIFSALMLAIAYVFGSLWLAVVGSMDLAAAFAAGCLPFVIPDCVKCALSIGLAQAVRRALPQIAD